MLKFTYFLCLSAILKECLSTPSAIRGVFHPRRKSDLFLSQNAIPGIAGVILPENIIPERTDVTNDFRPMFSNSNLRSIILGGNYPRQGLANPQPDKKKGGKNVMQQEEDMQGRGLLNMILDPISRVLFKKGSNTNSTEPPSGQASYVKELLACQRKLVLCSLTPIFNVRCYLNCLLAAHPIASHAKQAVNSFLKTLCNPIGTVFDWGVRLYEKNYKSVKSLSHFLTLFQVGASSYKRFGRMAANSLPTLLMKYSDNHEANQMKATINGLETATKNANAGRRKMDQLTNYACSKINLVDSVQQIVDAFYKNSKTVDMILSGVWSLSKLFKLIPDPKRSPIKAIFGALNILTGVECGFVAYGLKGEKTECDKDSVKWKILGKLLPAVKGTPAVCGAVPDFPFDIFDESFPSIFMKEKSTPTTESPVKMDGDVVGRSNLDQQMGWVDEVLKTFDNDD